MHNGIPHIGQQKSHVLKIDCMNFNFSDQFEHLALLSAKCSCCLKFWLQY